jgi:hypothetical protein
VPFICRYCTRTTASAFQTSAAAKKPCHRPYTARFDGLELDDVPVQVNAVDGLCKHCWATLHRRCAAREPKLQRAALEALLPSPANSAASSRAAADKRAKLRAQARKRLYVAPALPSALPSEWLASTLVLGVSSAVPCRPVLVHLRSVSVQSDKMPVQLSHAGRQG